MSINETVLEMHFHNSILTLIKQRLGLGPTGSVNFYKYSPQKEVFVGFDQAYVCTQLSEKELFTKLKMAASTNNYQLGPRFVGLFLQFKVVQPMSKKSKHTPPQVGSAPFFRSTLSTRQNINTGKAQHELLYLLSSNPGAFVYYACPMLFDRTALYGPPDLDQLRLVEVKSSAGPYLDNQQHFIYFDAPTSAPIWKSEPKLGDSISVEELAAGVNAYVRESDSQSSAKAVLQMITEAFGVRAVVDAKKTSLELVGDSFTLLEIKMSNG